MIRLEALESEVCREMGVTPDELRSAQRSTRIVIARQIFVWLARVHTCESYPDIARYFGRSSHGSACDQMKWATAHLCASRRVGTRDMLCVINDIEVRLDLPLSKRPSNDRARKHVQVRA